MAQAIWFHIPQSSQDLDCGVDPVYKILIEMAQTFCVLSEQYQGNQCRLDTFFLIILKYQFRAALGSNIKNFMKIWKLQFLEHRPNAATQTLPP